MHVVAFLLNGPQQLALATEIRHRLMCTQLTFLLNPGSAFAKSSSLTIFTCPEKVAHIKAVRPCTKKTQKNSDPTRAQISPTQMQGWPH